MASRRSTGDADAVLEALPDATAVLNVDGAIVSVNHASRMFALDNGGRPETTGVGVNYLELCRRAASAGSADAATARDHIESVLNGETVHQELEYPCPSPAVGRWFLLRVNPLPPPAGGAVVSHVNITRRKMAEEELVHAAAHDPLTALANRALFTDRLADALQAREGRPRLGDVGILFIDLDRFSPSTTPTVTKRVTRCCWSPRRDFVSRYVPTTPSPGSVGRSSRFSPRASLSRL